MGSIPIKAKTPIELPGAVQSQLWLSNPYYCPSAPRLKIVSSKASDLSDTGFDPFARLRQNLIR